jgi:hypothetical protein
MELNKLFYKKNIVALFLFKSDKLRNLVILFIIKLYKPRNFEMIHYFMERSYVSKKAAAGTPTQAFKGCDKK